MGGVPEPQRRGRRIAMSEEEVDAYLRTARVCRVATATPDGDPHVSPLWFAWDGAALWLYSVTRTRRHAHLQRNPRVAVVVDGGEGFFELHGVELRGEIEQIGESPRTGTPDRELAEPERIFADKYLDGNFVYDGRHAWLRLRPAQLVSWDFRKL